MTAKEFKARQIYLREQNAKQPDTLAHVPKRDWPTFPGLRPDAVMRSKTFLVQIFCGEEWVRLSFCRTAIGRDGHWLEGITWEELQRLKREAGYGEFDAVEAYPRDRDVVNVANMRHLWVPLKAPLPFAWRAKVVADGESAELEEGE
jgi:hypothetical protein